jgi:hypothetical protein
MQSQAASYDRAKQTQVIDGVTNKHPASELTAAYELRTMMQGSVVFRGGDDYARTRQIWNVAVQS